MIKIRWSVLFCVVGVMAWSAVCHAQSTAIATVLVDDPGNVADTATGLGAVADSFAIGRTEVTNAQYAEFLNAVASVSDPNALYSPFMAADPRGGILFSGPAGSILYFPKANMADKPVNFVNWYSAARFCNWLHNGQPVGVQDATTTEDGAYTMAGANFPPRNPLAKWFLPSEDEWYKAAYHDPDDPAADGGGNADYWLYPTRSDAVPTVATATPIGDVANPAANVANYALGADWNSQNGNVTTAASAGSFSHYGTFDQGGNVDEWVETPATLVPFNAKLRGGGFDSAAARLDSGSVLTASAGAGGSAIGFRVAAAFKKTVTFSIGPNTVGVPSPPQNDVFASPDEGDLYFTVAQLERDTSNRGNVLDVDGQTQLGLVAGDDIDALQGPMRSFPQNGGYRLIEQFVFSVIPGSMGQPGTPVSMESPTNGGDLFQTNTIAGAGHTLAMPERTLGLDETNPDEDVDALSLEPDAPFAVGTRIWFSLKAGSPTLGLNGWSAADVLTAQVGIPGTLAVAMPASFLGLDPADDLNALLMIGGDDANGDSDFDDAGDTTPFTYFSVAVGSQGAPGTDVATEAAGNGAASDVFLSKGQGVHNRVYDGVNDLLLDSDDDVDALEAPEVQCDNPPLIDFLDNSPPNMPPPPVPPPHKDPTSKVPLCYVIPICDTPFPKNWSGQISMKILGNSPGFPSTSVNNSLQGKKGAGLGITDKAQAMAALFNSIDCPGMPGKKLFQKAKIERNKAKFDPCIKNDPQINRIVAQVTVWIDPDCLPAGWICDLKVSLTNWTIGAPKPFPFPGGAQCDIRRPRLGVLGIPFEPGVFDIAFGSGDPNNPNSFVVEVTYEAGEDPVFWLEDIADQIRLAGGVAGVYLPSYPGSQPELWVERTPVDHTPAPGEVGGPVVIEGGTTADGVTTTYATDVLAMRVDCNENQIPDELDIRNGDAADCDNDGTLDSCEIAAGSSTDLNFNNIPDECETDCNLDGLSDPENIALGTSLDVWPFDVYGFPRPGSDGQPDECCQVPFPPDFDDDNDIDLLDYKFMQECIGPISGPSGAPNPECGPQRTCVVPDESGGYRCIGCQCGCADFNGDGVVDRADVPVLESFLTGPSLTR